MGIIESFILEYQNNESAYELVRKRVKETLKSLIDDAGIMAIISARVKDPERLREKLLDRNQEAQYKVHLIGEKSNYHTTQNLLHALRLDQNV